MRAKFVLWDAQGPLFIITAVALDGTIAYQRNSGEAIAAAVATGALRMENLVKLLHLTGRGASIVLEPVAGVSWHVFQHAVDEPLLVLLLLLEREVSVLWVEAPGGAE